MLKLPRPGLVKYALMNGQPVNSVVNGVLPIHAAASSGNEAVVRMLIEAGADVNSPRQALPSPLFDLCVPNLLMLESL